MADIVTFDGPNKIITEIDAGGDNTLDVAEIYSEWKVWATLSDNLKFEQAMSIVGGDEISATQSLGFSVFMENGWRIRPAESSHKLTLVGNIFTREAGESVFVDTIGSFNVNTETQVSSLIDIVNLETSLANLEVDIALIRAMTVNNVVITNTDPLTVTVFDTDGTTVVATYEITTDGLQRTRIT